MSVSIRFKNPLPNLFSPNSNEDPPSPCGPRAVEAPDRGISGEAPEHRVGRYREAPDAGDGRMNVLEQEFTHGRSQS